MAAIDSIYHYYLSTYANSAVSRYDSHKKSELRDIYNRMVKSNKDSPLYRIKNLHETAAYAIDIKESARRIKNVIASLSDNKEGIESAFAKKVATSSDESVVQATYIGTGEHTDPVDDFEIEVRQLALPQVNQGNYLEDNGKGIPIGNYAFDLNTASASYEFQFSVNEGESNLDILQKLGRLVKNADIGLKAEIVRDPQGQRSALRLESVRTGKREDGAPLFEIVAEGTTNSFEAMQILGIHNIKQPSRNASYLLNGEAMTSTSNSITVGQSLALHLKKTNREGESETIGYKPSVDAVADNLQELVDSYNSIIKIATNDAGARQQGNKLLSDMQSVTENYRDELEAIGLRTLENGEITVDRDLLADAVTSENAKENFSVLNAFKDALNERATMASINPMNYVNKILVAYKNPGRNFATPYITSIYSGMMMDRYC